MQSDKNSIHLTDHSFQKMCNSKYGINRGVYNVIDQWFYDSGVEDILERRKEILNFINFISITSGLDKKFGSGGLSRKLAEYIQECAVCG